ncbi:hypothetical protein OROMI_018590 [Orobanche minor]
MTMVKAYRWGSKDGNRKIAWVAWKKLSRSKFDGGFGFQDLRSFNTALLSKQGWRILSNPHSLLASVYKAKYFPHSSFLEARIGSRPSWTGRSILESRSLLLRGCRRSIHSGENTRIFQDPWLPGNPVVPPKGTRLLEL